MILRAGGLGHRHARPTLEGGYGPKRKMVDCEGDKQGTQHIDGVVRSRRKHEIYLENKENPGKNL